jgi:hypothetical protein
MGGSLSGWRVTQDEWKLPAIVNPSRDYDEQAEKTEHSSATITPRELAPDSRRRLLRQIVSTEQADVLHCCNGVRDCVQARDPGLIVFGCNRRKIGFARVPGA